MKNKLAKLKEWILAPYRKYQQKKKLDKKIKGLKKRDPFIYK